MGAQHSERISLEHRPSDAIVVEDSGVSLISCYNKSFLVSPAKPPKPHLHPWQKMEVTLGVLRERVCSLNVELEELEARFRSEVEREEACVRRRRTRSGD